jgi:hypothetical protein
MLSNYANQALSWEVKTGENDYSQPTFAAAVTIYGRKTVTNKIVRNKQGEEVLVTGTVLTESDVSEGDRIDGRTVMSSGPAVKLDGSAMFNRVYLI